MILGRPTNLWLGAVTAFIGLGSTFAVNVAHADPTLVTNIAGPLGIAAGALIYLVANQPPTLNVGDPYKVVTPAGVPNATGVATTPPVSVTVATTTPETSSQLAQDVDIEAGPLDPDPASEGPEG